VLLRPEPDLLEPGLVVLLPEPPDLLRVVLAGGGRFHGGEGAVPDGEAREEAPRLRQELRPDRIEGRRRRGSRIEGAGLKAAAAAAVAGRVGTGREPPASEREQPLAERRATTERVTAEREFLLMGQLASARPFFTARK
jgi:hypothetical protein